jgi:hypothetical protein
MVLRLETRDATVLGAADWLSLAAAPTFAIMALLTVILAGGVPDLLCSAAQMASPLSGMALMYLLMSAFHSAPWLKLISGRRTLVDRMALHAVFWRERVANLRTLLKEIDP